MLICGQFFFFRYVSFLPKLSAPPLFGHMFLFFLTETSCSFTFRAHVPLPSYRNLLLLHFSGTCSSSFLPKLSAPPLFGHMFLFFLTEISRAPSLFGHMFLFLLTETSCSSTFRAHVPLLSYRNLVLLHFSGTCSSSFLPKPRAPPLFGHMFLFLLTETFYSSTFRAHVPLLSDRNLVLLHFSGTCSSSFLPKPRAPQLFGHMFLFLLTETSCSSTFRAHVILPSYRNFLLPHFSGNSFLTR